MRQLLCACTATWAQIVAIAKSIAALLKKKFRTMLDFGGVDMGVRLRLRRCLRLRLRLRRLFEAWAYFTFYGKYRRCDEGGGKKRKILQESGNVGGNGSGVIRRRRDRNRLTKAKRDQQLILQALQQVEVDSFVCDQAGFCSPLSEMIEESPTAEERPVVPTVHQDLDLLQLDLDLSALHCVPVPKAQLRHNGPGCYALQYDGTA